MTFGEFSTSVAKRAERDRRCMFFDLAQSGQFFDEAPQPEFLGIECH